MARGIRPAYSHYISPEDIVARDKLTQYNDQLLALIMWEGSGNTNAAEMIAMTQDNLTSIYNSMSTEEQTQADTNRQKILGGERQYNGATISGE